MKSLDCLGSKQSPKPSTSKDSTILRLNSIVLLFLLVVVVIVVVVIVVENMIVVVLVVVVIVLFRHFSSFFSYRSFYPSLHQLEEYDVDGDFLHFFLW